MSTSIDLISSDLKDQIWASADEWMSMPHYYKNKELTKSQMQCLAAICDEVPFISNEKVTVKQRKENTREMWERRAHLATERLGLSFTADQFKMVANKARFEHKYQ